jgi:hypothetical protein
MARKPLRSQLNQIRAWVRQGRTDAWIAHQLDVPASELREFRRRHELAPEDEEAGDLELRDEIEAEIEATLDEEEAEEEELEAEEEELEAEEEELDEEDEEAEEAEAGDEAAGAEGEENGKAPAGRRRRRRSRGRGRGRGGGARAGAAMQATFDHGAEEGFGLWLDPAVEDDPVYSEHWAGHRPVEVTIEPDRIVIRRA